MTMARSLSLMLALGALTAAPTVAQRVQRVQVGQPEHFEESNFDNGYRGDRRGRRRARPAQRELLVRQMNVVQAGRQADSLQLQYDIESRGLVELHVEVHRARRVREVRATVQGRGRVALGRTGRDGTLVRVHAVDGRGRTLPIRLGRARVQQLEFEVVSQRPHSNDAHQHAEEFGETLYDDGQSGVYYEDVDQVPVRPVPARRGQNISAISQACDQAFTGNASESRCLEIALTIPNPVATIRACDDAFTGNASALSCLEQAPQPVHVSVCDDLMTGDASEFECISEIAAARADARTTREVARVCDARTGDAAELACVQQILSAQPVPRRRGRR